MDTLVAAASLDTDYFSEKELDVMDEISNELIHALSLDTSDTSERFFVASARRELEATEEYLKELSKKATSELTPVEERYLRYRGMVATTFRYSETESPSTSCKPIAVRQASALSRFIGSGPSIYSSNSFSSTKSSPRKKTKGEPLGLAL